MKPQDLKNLEYVLKHYLSLTVKRKSEPLRVIAQQLLDISERELLKL